MKLGFKKRSLCFLRLMKRNWSFYMGFKFKNSFQQPHLSKRPRCGRVGCEGFGGVKHPSELLLILIPLNNCYPLSLLATRPKSSSK